MEVSPISVFFFGNDGSSVLHLHVVTLLVKITRIQGANDTNVEQTKS